MAGTAVHEKKDDRFGFRRKVRLLRRERIIKLGELFGNGAAREEVIAKHSGQSHSAETAAGLPKKLATGTATKLTTGRSHSCLTSGIAACGNTINPDK